MENKSSLQRKEDVEAIQKYLPGLPYGTIVSWLEITQATGVHMDWRGRALVRLVLRKNQLEYLPVHGHGLQIVDSACAIEAVRLRDRRVGGAVRRSARAGRAVRTRQLEGMSDRDRQEFEQRESIRLMMQTESRTMRDLGAKPTPAPVPMLPQRRTP